MTPIASQIADIDAPILLPELPKDLVERCGLVGEHPAMQEVYRLMSRAAPTRVPVLIFGETGSGREMIARCIHRKSPVSRGPWIAVQCATASAEELESDLFGAAVDSDDEALPRRLSRFEQASGGTIFLDDVTSLGPVLQARLLRAVELGEIERTDNGETVSVDARIITSTTRDLRAEAGDGRFRSDLYYRLAIVTINVPRLIARGDDLLLLIAHFVGEFRAKAQSRQPLTRVTADAYRALCAHQWTGNVRELRSAIEHVVSVARDGTIGVGDLPDELLLEARVQRDEFEDAGTRPSAPLATDAHVPSLAEIEAQHISLVLAHANGVIHVAAEILGIHRNTLTRKMKIYGL